MNLIEEQDFAYYECLQAEKDKEVARFQREQARLEGEKVRLEAERETLQKEVEEIRKEKEKVPVDLDLVRLKRIQMLSKKSPNP